MPRDSPAKSQSTQQAGNLTTLICFSISYISQSPRFLSDCHFFAFLSDDRPWLIGNLLLEFGKTLRGRSVELSCSPILSRSPRSKCIQRGRLNGPPAKAGNRGPMSPLSTFSPVTRPRSTTQTRLSVSDIDMRADSFRVLHRRTTSKRIGP